MAKEEEKPKIPWIEFKMDDWAEKDRGLKMARELDKIYPHPVRGTLWDTILIRYKRLPDISALPQVTKNEEKVQTRRENDKLPDDRLQSDQGAPKKSEWFLVRPRPKAIEIVFAPEALAHSNPDELAKKLDAAGRSQLMDSELWDKRIYLGREKRLNDTLTKVVQRIAWFQFLKEIGDPRHELDHFNFEDEKAKAIEEFSKAGGKKTLDQFVMRFKKAVLMGEM